MSDALGLTVAYLAEQLSPTQGTMLAGIMNGTYEPQAGDGITDATMSKVVRMGLLTNVRGWRGDLTAIGRLVAEAWEAR